LDLPRISIITPSYNQGDYLEQTIQSVLEQGYPNLEYMVIDGGSTDQSVKIIKKYEKHLAYWTSEKDQGQSHAINKGLQRATGEIINWLNSDDYYQPGALQAVANAFANPAVNVVCGCGRLFRNPDETLYFSNGTDVYAGNLAKTVGWARMDQPETFFRHEAVRRIGLLDVRLHYLMDRDWWIKYLFCYGLDGIAQIPDVLVNFRLHGQSKTVSQPAAFQVEHDSFYHSLARQFGFIAEADAIERHFSVNKSFVVQLAGQYDPQLVQQALHYFLLFRADEHYAASQYAKAKAILEDVRPEALSPAERPLVQKLKRRSSFPLAQLVSLTRKLRRFEA
jgi:glycosyltransferase involved in cell wall biosynthesis